jgi:hypothetical protein
MMMKRTRYLPLLLGLCVGEALAGTPIHLRHDASPDAHVSINNTAGTVTVLAWDRSDVEVTGELGDGARPLLIAGSKSDLAITVQPQAGTGWFGWGSRHATAPSTLEVHVPKTVSLVVRVISAPVVIDGTEGGDLSIETVSGRVRINARAPTLKVHSVSGSIELAGQAEHVELQTVSGDILAPSLGADAALQTISGRIQADGNAWQKLTLSTVSGDVQLAGSLAANGTLAIDSMSGDVQLQLPADTSGTLHASTFSGDLRSDFGSPAKTDHGPGSTLDASLGDHRGSIRVETFSGDLRIRKKS